MISQPRFLLDVRAQTEGWGAGRIPNQGNRSHAIRSLSLPQFYTQHKEPELLEQGRSPDTIATYRLHVARWLEWQQKYRISNPVLPISAIFATDLRDWRSWLLAHEIASTNRSANKHVGSIQSILATAGEHDAHDSPPRIKPLEHQAAAQKSYLTYDQVNALYQACDVAQWPAVDRHGQSLPHSAPTYWRAFIVLQFNYGQRTEELWSYGRHQRTLTWRQVSWEAETPAPEGSAQNDAGWFFYVPQKQRRKKPAPLVLPLNRTTAEHLRSIMPPGELDLDGRIFPAPFSRDSFYATWRAIVAASGARLKQDLETGDRPPLNIKIFRKSCETWHDKHSRGDGRAGIGEIITGHAERSVSGKHYANRERRLVEAVERFPQPSAFAQIHHAQQMRLFR